MVKAANHSGSTPGGGIEVERRPLLAAGRHLAKPPVSRQAILKFVANENCYQISSAFVAPVSKRVAGMLCELRAMADDNGSLHLCVGANGADWLHYIWRGAELTVLTAAGERKVSSRTAIKLMLRELWLHESVHGVGASNACPFAPPPTGAS